MRAVLVLVVAALILLVAGLHTVGFGLAGAVADANRLLGLMSVDPGPRLDRPEPASRSAEVVSERSSEARGARSVVPVRLAGGHEMEAVVTAYAPGDDGVDGITATGLPMDRGVVAVDPEVIPLGSVVYVPGYGYALACDVGGAIKGRRMDVYLSSRREAIAWGVRRVRVVVYSGGGGSGQSLGR